MSMVQVKHFFLPDGPDGPRYAQAVVPVDPSTGLPIDGTIWALTSVQYNINGDPIQLQRTDGTVTQTQTISYTGTYPDGAYTQNFSAWA